MRAATADLRSVAAMAGCNPLPSADNEYITLDATRRLLHISKRRCAALLQSGSIPCTVSGKKTRQYHIRRSDVDNIGELPAYSKPDKAPFPTGLREWLNRQWQDLPDILTPKDVEEITGYSQSAVCGWLLSGKLKYVMVNGTQTVALVWLIDFMCGEGMKIRRKSDKHTEIMESFLVNNL